MGGASSMRREVAKCYKISVEEPEGKKLVRRSRL